MAVKYLSNLVKDLKVGIKSFSESRTSLTVVGNVGIGTANPTDVVGVANTSVLAVGILTAYKIYSTLYGEFLGNVSGGSLSGTALSISGISTLGTVKISSGIITATCNATSKLARKVYDDFISGDVQTVNDNLCDIRSEFEKYNLISGLHTFFGKNEKCYRNLLPPLSMLSPQEEKELIEKLSQLNFSTRSTTIT